MNSNTEHSKKLRANTATEKQKKQIEEGGFKFTALIVDKEIAKFARENIPNRRQFLINAIKNYMEQLKKA
jgi:hypothetical protein